MSFAQSRLTTLSICQVFWWVRSSFTFLLWNADFCLLLHSFGPFRASQFFPHGRIVGWTLIQTAFPADLNGINRMNFPASKSRWVL
jgi:hypothetical protein